MDSPTLVPIQSMLIIWHSLDRYPVAEFAFGESHGNSINHINPASGDRPMGYATLSTLDGPLVTENIPSAYPNRECVQSTMAPSHPYIK